MKIFRVWEIVGLLIRFYKNLYTVQFVLCERRCLSFDSVHISFYFTRVLMNGIVIKFKC